MDCLDYDSDSDSSVPSEQVALPLREGALDAITLGSDSPVVVAAPAAPTADEVKANKAASIAIAKAKYPAFEFKRKQEPDPKVSTKKAKVAAKEASDKATAAALVAKIAAQKAKAASKAAAALPASSRVSQQVWDANWLNEFTWARYDHTRLTWHCALCHTTRASSAFFVKGCSSLRRQSLGDHSITLGHIALAGAAVAGVTGSPSAAEEKKLSSKLAPHFMTAYEVSKCVDSARSFEPRLLMKAMVLEAAGAPAPSSAYFSKDAYKDINAHMSKVIKADDIAAFRRSPVIGICCDESTDTSVVETIIIYIAYIKADFTKDIKYYELKKINDTTGQGVCDALIASLKDILGPGCDLHQKVMSLGSDGASAMIGEEAGAATLLKKKARYLISFHCICHKLALGMNDAMDEVPGARRLEKVINGIYVYYARSAQRRELLSAEFVDAAKTAIAPRRACQTRWLSTGQASTSVCDSIMQHLNVFTNASVALATVPVPPEVAIPE